MRSHGSPKRVREDNIKMNFKRNRVWGCGLDSSGSRYGPTSGSCKHDNET